MVFFFLPPPFIRRSHLDSDTATLTGSSSFSCVLFGLTPLAAAFSSSSRALLRSSHRACLRASSDADWLGLALGLGLGIGIGLGMGLG